jgi:predicted dehydrogenase
MKFLIVGFGSIGRRHLRNLRALGEEDILLYRTHHSTLPEVEIDGLPVETNLEAALAHHPDAVIIANPTALHMDVAIPAAEAGCHILMEKPIADSLDKVDHLRAALAGGMGQLLVGFQFHYHPALRQIKAWLDESAIGRVYSFRAHWGEYLPNWHPWEDYKQSYAARSELGGGVILTLTHPLDYLRWLMGEVQSLWAFTGTLGELEIKVVDSAEIGLQLQNGAAGTVHVDYLQRPAGHTLQILGTGGMIQWDNASGCANLYQASGDRWEKYTLPEGFDRNDLFVDELRHFIRVCQGLENPACTLVDGAWALRLALSAHHSALSGTQVHF